VDVRGGPPPVTEGGMLSAKREGKLTKEGRKGSSFEQSQTSRDLRAVRGLLRKRVEGRCCGMSRVLLGFFWL
jgi:hypothetical protein